MGSYLLVLLAFLVFFSTAHAREEAPTLRIGHVGHDHHAALYVACLEGERFEKDYGLYLKPVKEKEFYEFYDRGRKIANVELYRSGGGSKMPTLMSQGHFEIGFGGVAPVAFFVDKGSPIKIISPLHTKGDMLVVSPSVDAKNWAEFLSWVRKEEKQLRVGYKNPVAVAKLIFEYALKAEGISFTGDKGDTSAEILMVHMKGERNLIPGLQNKIIDAYVSNNPWCAIAESKGVGKIVADLNELPPGIWKDHPCCCLAATDRLIAEKPEVASKIVELVVIATKLINEEPEVGYNCAARWIGTTPEVESVSMSTSGYLTEVTAEWKKGMYTWCDAMNEMGKLIGELKGKKGAEVDRLLFDFSLLEKAVDDLKKR